MKKITKSFLAVSLSSTLFLQNTFITGYCQNLNTKESNENIQISSNYSNTTNQIDPLMNQDYSMGDINNSATTYSLKNRSLDLEIKTLSNPNAIGLGTVTANSLNVRTEPSTAGDIITFIVKDDDVEILEKKGNWYKININNITGYVSASYIKLNPIEKGIDVSKWNGTIDWNKIKADGIDYVIIRGGFGNSTVDSYFKYHIEGASKAGLKIGIYWFSYATSVEKAQQEAEKCLETINPYKDKISYPVFFDYEYDSVSYANKLGISVNKDLVSDMATAFLAKIKNAGYIPGMYTNRDFGDKYFNEDILSENYLWFAQYSSTCTSSRPYMMWQYTETGTINGIGTSSNPKYFDMNYTYLKPFSENLNPIPEKTDLSSVSISKVDDKIYTGNEIRPDITVTLNEKTLKLNEDYTVSYSNNTSVGTGNITIEGIGDYKGTKSTTFIINPPQVQNISLVKKTTTSLNLSWEKLDSVTGYEVYKYNNNSNSYELINTINDNNVNTYTDENLDSASIYSYKIVSYKIVDEKYYYSSDSNEFKESTKINKVNNVKFDDRTTNALKISWDKVDGVDGYNVYKLDTKTNTYKVVQTLYGDSTTSYTNTNLTSATNYYYKVRAFKYLNDMTRYSDYSSSLKATTRPLQPSVSLSSTTSKSINASWTKISSRTTGYEVYMSTSKDGIYTTVGTTLNKTFTKTNLTKGKTYYFKVRAYRMVDNNKIYSLYSSVKSITCK